MWNRRMQFMDIDLLFLSSGTSKLASVLSNERRRARLQSEQCERTNERRTNDQDVIVPSILFLDASTHLYRRVCPSVRNAVVSNTRKRVILTSEVEGMSTVEGRGKGAGQG